MKQKEDSGSVKKLIKLSLVLASGSLITIAVSSIAFLVIHIDTDKFEVNWNKHQTTHNITAYVKEFVVPKVINGDSIPIMDKKTNREDIAEGMFSYDTETGRYVLGPGGNISDALLGHAVACYTGNEGVLRNYKKSFELSLKSAMLGNSLAQCFVAALYINGYGVRRDLIEAYAWVLVSNSYGNKNIQGFNDLSLEMEKGFTPRQIESGQNRAMQIKDQISRVIIKQ